MPSRPSMFSFNREPPRQRAARRALAPAALLAGVSFLVLDRPLSALLGGVWGVLVAMMVVLVPLGTLWWSGETGARGGAAWRAGAVLGLLCVAVYTWVFIGSWR